MSFRSRIGGALILIVCLIVITRLYPLTEAYLGHHIFHPATHPESISVCVISKDELDVAEFVEYHQKIGIDKIFFLELERSIQ